MNRLDLPSQTHSINVALLFAPPTHGQQTGEQNSNAQLPPLEIDPPWQSGMGQRPRVNHSAAFAAPATLDIDTLRACFQATGISLHKPVAEATILHRLNAVKISVDTFLNAIGVAQSPNHPLWQKLRAKPGQIHLVLRDLAAVTTTKGWKISKRQAIINAHNHPYLLCATLWKDLLR